MKFGERLNEVSVPGWSVHNVDYDSLKHQIKVHTTKDQATAIAIPGHQDHALQRFEDAFYLELCSEHNRIGLFVTSKTDEISRRLRHISGLLCRLQLKYANKPGWSDKPRQQRFVKYRAQTEECGQDIEALGRFVEAQVTAFHKILKKYKKWTSSASLSFRFKNNVLQSPKSFTKHDLAPLQLQFREIRTTLESCPSSDDGNDPETPSSPDGWDAPTGGRGTPQPESQRDLPSAASNIAPTKYWNEYEDGSEMGGDDEDGAYVIYIEPDANQEFPGVAYVKSVFNGPVDQVRHWLHAQKPPKDVTADSPTIVGSPSEVHSLLGHSRNRSNSNSTNNYFTIGNRRPSTGHEIRTEDEFLSSDEGEQHAFVPSPRFSSPFASGVETKMRPYQDVVLTRSIVLAFIASFMLLGVSGLLVITGRRSLRLEVDVGAAAGSVASLLCACMGLGTMLYRQYPSGYTYSLAVWTTFVVVCTLNGALLVVVVSSSVAV